MPGTTETSVRGAKRLQPEPGQLDLLVERQIDEVAGDGDMVGRVRPHVCHDRVDDIVVQEAAAVALPVHEADRALRDELTKLHFRQGSKMNVRKMCEPEHVLFVGHAAGAFQKRLARQMSAGDPEAPFRQTGWPGLRARLFHTYFLIRRPMTLGARAVIHDRAGGSVFLIRHTYVPGWQLPGGGVESGETVRKRSSASCARSARLRSPARPS